MNAGIREEMAVIARVAAATKVAPSAFRLPTEFIPFADLKSVVVENEAEMDADRLRQMGGE